MASLWLLNWSISSVLCFGSVTTSFLILTGSRFFWINIGFNAEVYICDDYIEIVTFRAWTLCRISVGESKLLFCVICDISVKYFVGGLSSIFICRCFRSCYTQGRAEGKIMSIKEEKTENVYVCWLFSWGFSDSVFLDGLTKLVQDRVVSKSLVGPWNRHSLFELRALVALKHGSTCFHIILF